MNFALTSGVSLRLARAVVALCLLCGSLLSPTVAVAATVYSYDALGRVTSVTYDNGLVIAYSYDAAGNRTQQVVSGSNAGAFTWSANSQCPTNCWNSSGPTTW